jgi:pimeloyl-ACP methyl ester carboxylesterase
MDSQPVVLVGTSLGGAVALDFATAHPEAVERLILVDAGGVSYKAPEPDVVTALYPAVMAVKAFANVIQQNVPSMAARLACLHRNDPLWLEAGSEYVRSGGYARSVGPALIRTVPQETLVIWGSDDPILPVSDADEFERLLPRCAAKKIIGGSGHSPQLDNPDPVAKMIADFVREA